MKKILHYININVPAAQVFAALTTQEGLSNWWSTKVVVTAAEVGSIVDFTFLEGFNPDMKITRLENNVRLDWECVGGHDNWQDNTFSFVLTDNGGTTGLMFTQIYAQELADEVYGTYNYNWGYYLESLRLYCEEGAGKPYQAQ